MRNWREAVLDTNLLCSNDLDADMRFDFMLLSDDGAHKLLGSHTTSMRKLNNTKEFKAGSNKVVVSNFELKPIVNFLEYVFGGCQLCLSVAIDFTASNG